MGKVLLVVYYRFQSRAMRRYICLGLHGKVFKLTKEIERRKWALLTHSNTAHMQIQMHRYALEQGALCVHVLYWGEPERAPH